MTKPIKSGRRPDGKFAAGNAGGPGNPHAADVGRLRAKFYAEIRDADVTRALSVLRRVMRKGKDNDQLAAARELLDRVLGKAGQADVLARVEEMEARLARLAGDGGGGANGNGERGAAAMKN